MHPVEGIWQSTDGFKYGIVASSSYSGTKSFKIEILSVPSEYSKGFRVGENKGSISEGSTNGIYSLEYRIKYFNYDGSYRIGEDETDPVFTVTDLLPHLAKKQLGEKLQDAIKGENLDLLIGSIPCTDAEKDKVKKNICIWPR